MAKNKPPRPETTPQVHNLRVRTPKPSTPEADAPAKDVESVHSDKGSPSPPTSPSPPPQNMSTIPFSKTISLRAEEVTQDWDDTTHDADAIAHIREWHDYLTEEEADPMAQVERFAGSHDAHPLGFLCVDSGNRVWAIHSLGVANLLDRNAHGNAGYYGFIGDVYHEGDNEWSLPTMIEVMTAELFASCEEQPATTTKACTAAIKEGNNELLPPNGQKLSVPRLLPIPISWLPDFIEPQTISDTYSYLIQKTKKWKSTEGKAAAKLVREYARGLRTGETIQLDKGDPPTTVSILLMANETSVTPDGQLLDWAGRHLLSMVQPRVATTPPKEGTPPTNANGDDGLRNVAAAVLTAIQTMTAVQQSNAAEAELTRETRVEQERVKKRDPCADDIPEPLLLPLLGYSGLSWEGRNHLNPIFAKLHKAGTKREKYALLKAFFSALAAKDAVFHGFVNYRVFDDIINHRFAPGLKADTAGSGVGLLAFVPLTAHEIQDNEAEEAIYDEATVITTSDSRKKQAVRVVSPPQSLPELFLLLMRFQVVCDELWSTDSQLSSDVFNLNEGLLENQLTLAIDSTAIKTLATEITWAITLETHQFFNRSQLKENLIRERPKFIKCNLKAHQQNFTCGVRHQLAGMPPSWRTCAPPIPQGTPPTRDPNRGKRRQETPAGANQGGGGGGGGDGNKNQRTGFPNPARPAPIATSQELTQLRGRFKTIRLTKICEAANLRNSPELGRRSGVDDSMCLVFSLLGHCGSPACRRQHSNVSDEQAKKMLALLLPGINKLLASGPAGPNR